MIKAEVVFDEYMIKINGYEVYMDEHICKWVVSKNNSCVTLFTIEQAISYCLENK